MLPVFTHIVATTETLSLFDFTDEETSVKEAKLLA